MPEGVQDSDTSTEQAEQATRKRDWSSDDWLGLFGVTAIAAFSRIFRLVEPKTYVFDETYYAEEACFYVEASKKLCEYKNPPAEVHPPLAKWLIGTGIDVFGFDAFGWRVVAAIFGIIGVALLYLLARKILGSTMAAIVASGLLAFDPLHFLHSRMALLDIFPAVFGGAAFLFIVYDRERMKRARDAPNTLSPESKRRNAFARPWRLAAGLAAGAATASKWSGGLILIGVIVLTIVWELARRKDLGWRQASIRFLKEEGPSIVLYLGLAPFALYVATYIGRLHGPVLDPLAEDSWFREWLRYQTNALTFHRSEVPHHGYESPPLTWILIKRPLLYYAEVSGDQKASVYALGNPLIWWPSIAAFAYMFWKWIRTRDWRRPEGLILFGFFITYLIWPVLAPQRPSVFLFYMVPTIPFICLAIAYAIRASASKTMRRVLLGITTVFSVGWFFAYYPIIANVPISQDRWDAQMIFDFCEAKKAREVTTNTVTQAINRQTTIIKTRTTTRINKNIPPEGWCWE